MPPSNPSLFVSNQNNAYEMGSSGHFLLNPRDCYLKATSTSSHLLSKPFNFMDNPPPIMPTSMGPFPFLKLPPELRCLVYREALRCGEHPLKIFAIPPLCRTSRLILQEAYPLLLSYNRFEITCLVREWWWFKMRGSELTRHLRCLAFYYRKVGTRRSRDHFLGWSDGLLFTPLSYPNHLNLTLNLSLHKLRDLFGAGYSYIRCLHGFKNAENPPHRAIQRLM